MTFCTQRVEYIYIYAYSLDKYKKIIAVHWVIVAVLRYCIAVQMAHNILIVEYVWCDAQLMVIIYYDKRKIN